MTEAERTQSSLLLEAVDTLDRLRLIWRALDMMMADLSDRDHVGAMREVSQLAKDILDHALECVEAARPKPIEEVAT